MHQSLVNLLRAGKATLSAKLPTHINHSFRGCKILTSGDKDFSKLRGLPCSARTGCHFLTGSTPAAHSSPWHSLPAQPGHMQVGSASSRAVWNTAGQTPPQEPQGHLGDNAGSLLAFLLRESHDLWEAKLLEKSDSDHLDVFATCHRCYSSQGFLSLLSPTSDYQLRNGFKWRLISWVGPWDLHGLMWAAGWDGGGEETSAKLASCKPHSTPVTPGTGMSRSQREMAVVAGLE